MSLVEHPKNPNTHPQAQLERLADVIRGNGWRQPITVSDRSGYIIKGHGRYQAAKLAVFTDAPVEVQLFKKMVYCKYNTTAKFTADAPQGRAYDLLRAAISGGHTANVADLDDIVNKNNT